MENEPQPNDASSTPPVVLITVGFLVGAAVVGACWLSSRTTKSQSSKIVRNVTVEYMYETDPGSAAGHKNLAVDSIEFLPGYIMMTDTRGRTQLLALNRLRKFSYQPTDK